MIRLVTTSTAVCWILFMSAPTSLMGECPGDMDADNDVDIMDAQALIGCILGPGMPPVGGCVPADIDLDNDTDLADFAEIQLSFGQPCSSTEVVVYDGLGGSATANLGLSEYFSFQVLNFLDEVGGNFATFTVPGGLDTWELQNLSIVLSTTGPYGGSASPQEVPLTEIPDFLIFIYKRWGDVASTIVPGGAFLQLCYTQPSQVSLIGTTGSGRLAYLANFDGRLSGSIPISYSYLDCHDGPAYLEPGAEYAVIVLSSTYWEVSNLLVSTSTIAELGTTYYFYSYSDPRLELLENIDPDGASMIAAQVTLEGYGNPISPGDPSFPCYVDQGQQPAPYCDLGDPLDAEPPGSRATLDRSE